MPYKSRIADRLLENKLNTFGASLIVGPKGCGKTTTAKMHAKSYIEMQDEDKKNDYLSVAATQPSRLLIGDNPRLIDEWQDAPSLWGAVRKSVDDRQETGLYILTGSTSHTVETPHTGTMRISTLKMYPMSLYESEESNGTVSLMDLFNNSDSFDGCQSQLSVDDLVISICRGGWPLKFIIKNAEDSLDIARDLFYQICNRDISAVDRVSRNPIWAETLLKSYSRNICTLASYETILQDVSTNCDIGKTAFWEYISALEKLFIIEDVEAWCPSIRSKTAIRSSKKRNLIDPSIAVAALGITPEYFNTDFNTLGFLFESLCIRDLKVYSSAQYGRVSYYHDRYGLEADVVLHLADGRYALIEVKLGQRQIDEGADHLIRIEQLIRDYNESERQVPLRLPDLKIVLTGTEYGYRRDDGVLVIPIGCLKD